MKGITLIVLCSILVLSSLINVTFGYSMKVSLNFPERAGFPSKTTLRCDSGNYIVVRKGILFYNNGKKNEKAWYPPKMACDFEETCTFELVEEQYKYLELKEGENLELQIQYDCKPKNFKGNPRRISQYGQIGKCPHDSFVQKHVGYIWNDDIVSNSETAKKEREVIAMSVCAQVRRFREANPNTPIDPNESTVFLIHDKHQLTKNFEPSGNNDCKLTGNALARSFKYQCSRGANKWTCDFKGKGMDVARHIKNNGHLLSQNRNRNQNRNFS